MSKSRLWVPLYGLFALSGGGLLLHVRIHPPDVAAFNLIATICAATTVVTVPVLFCFRRTAPWAYLLNVASVVLGTVTMAYYTLTHWQGPTTWSTVLLQSTLADILILSAKLPLGHVIWQYWQGCPRAAGKGDDHE